MKTLEKKTIGIIPNSVTKFYNPWNRFFSSDLLDFWDGDTIAETIPSVNILEEDDFYKLDMAVPGLRKENFNIDIDENVMTISCENESEKRGYKDRSEKKNYSRKEYSYLCFSRSFVLPDHVNVNHIVAKYNDGILSLSIPKSNEVQANRSQKIRVQ
ncbi:MAG TPA: Hsp20/alpha crystallin family protein [Bacteroidia bacterium]|nr:Hsp20/alpha crystallin family protein [Bacteroidia bacterium]